MNLVQLVFVYKQQSDSEDQVAEGFVKLRGMFDLQQYKLFILNCTTNANSVNNYSDFKRINECIKELGYNKTILEFDNSVDLTNLINQLNSLATYQQINQNR